MQRFLLNRIIVVTMQGETQKELTLEREREIIRLCRKDAVHFGELFDAYYATIFQYLLRRTADPALAQDIAAETFYKAYQNVHRYKWRGVSINNWFYKIATNELRGYFRKQKYAPKSLEHMLENEGYEPVSDSDVQAEMVAIQDAIERETQFLHAQNVLSTLPLKYQEALTLRFVEKKKVSEIALILHKREGTVKSLLSRGLSKARAALDVEMQPNESSSIESYEQPLITRLEVPYEE